MNINYGLLPPLEAPSATATDGKRLPHKERGRAKKRLMGERALADLDAWIGAPRAAAAAAESCPSRRPTNWSRRSAPG